MNQIRFIQSILNFNLHPQKKVLSYVGTNRYACISAHQVIEQTPKDDLEYVLIYLTTQHLQWMNIEKTDVQRLDKIGMLKESVLLEDLCSVCPNSMLKFYSLQTRRKQEG
ncbi:unnamed protein product [Paramecium octaurelia]|uniref:Uncharacterized protein n=1 Tax=Paramecium octaurelia TaxID=43137 RepID=A0A8S1V9U6_PAROT|nr:unnamed protein product [Paramecium octaurelia]